MKKILLIGIMIILSSSIVFAAGNTEANTVNLKFCTLENTEHGQGVLLNTFKEKVEQLSGGQIKVSVFHNGSLYTQDGAIPALISGELEMNLTSIQQTADYLPSVAMFASTYMFQDYEHMRTVMDSEIGDDMADKIAEASGYRPLGYYYNGSRQLDLRTTKPILTPGDLKGVILRMPSSEAWLDAGESLGATATPLAYAEVYTALQTGTIDAQDNPLPATKNMKFYEVTKQLSLTYHIIDFGLVAMNNSVWEKMTDQQKTWVKQAIEEAVKACDQAVVSQEASLVSFFEKEGLIITRPDIKAFSEYAHKYYLDNGLTSQWDMELYYRVQKMAK